MRSPLALAAAALLALAGVGCGSSSSSSPSPPSAAKSSTRPQAATLAKTGTQSGTTTTPGKVGEVSPSGDIPDNQAYVRSTLPGGGASVKVPEGWSRVTSPRYVLFTDKLNSIRAEMGPPVGTAAAVARLSRTVPGFRKGTVSTVERPAGRATRITYLAQAPPNPVTGKRVTDAVERYLFSHHGRELVLTLSGPRGADNVDPWRIVTTSVRFAR